MTLLRWICVGYVFALGFAAALNYIPGITDEEGRSFGIFALDIYDDALHLFSAAWAGRRRLDVAQSGEEFPVLFRRALSWRRSCSASSPVPATLISAS